MFNNNLLLIKLKQQLNSKKVFIKGKIKCTDKGFGFLEINNKKNYFIPSIFMKKVIHGDKVFAQIIKEKNRDIAEPKELIEQCFNNFIGKIIIKNNCFFIIPDIPFFKEKIPIIFKKSISINIESGDWVYAKILNHPLKNSNNFCAKIISLIAKFNNNKAPWKVTLFRYNLDTNAPEMPDKLILSEYNIKRKDLTKLDFFTIDGSNTEDIDDAIYINKSKEGSWIINVAIADPTAWIPEDSSLDIIASKRAFTSYLPCFNVPMLPRYLSENICSLKENKIRPALVCKMKIQKNGELCKKVDFFIAWIKSKSKLIYCNVSNWLKNTGSWKPINKSIENQIKLLYDFCKIRIIWRKNNSLIFQEKPYYKFIIDNNGNVNNIISKRRSIADKMIEETMIAANICAAHILKDNLGYGLYNIHNGFDQDFINQTKSLLLKYNIKVNSNDLLTIKGFCNIQKSINSIKNNYLINRIRKFQKFSEISSSPGPHFGLGLDVYATWTSPIRKYSDMINHRLLKSIIGIGSAKKPNKNLINNILEKKRKNKLACQYIENWLYAKFLKTKININNKFSAEIIDILKNGMKVKLLSIGAIAFIPSFLIHKIHNEINFNQNIGVININGKNIYLQGDIINVIVYKVKIEKRLIIVRPI